MDRKLAVIEISELEAMIREAVRAELGSRETGDVLTKDALGKEYGWSSSTINRYMRLGMPSEGPGRPRFRRSKVDIWLASQNKAA